MNISLMKQQSFVTHTIRQTEIPASLDSWATDTLPVTALCPQNYCFSLYFRENL